MNEPDLMEENARLKAALADALAKLELRIERELPAEAGVPAPGGAATVPETLLMARCAKHYNVPQLNRNEATGAECGACVAEQIDRLLAAEISNLKSEISKPAVPHS